MSPRHRQLKDATPGIVPAHPSREAEIYPEKCAQAAYTRQGQGAAECRQRATLTQESLERWGWVCRPHPVDCHQALLSRKQSRTARMPGRQQGLRGEEYEGLGLFSPKTGFLWVALAILELTI